VLPLPLPLQLPLSSSSHSIESFFGNTAKTMLLLLLL
jgi:hypothetical protein